MMPRPLWKIHLKPLATISTDWDFSPHPFCGNSRILNCNWLAGLATCAAIGSQIGRDHESLANHWQGGGIFQNTGVENEASNQLTNHYDLSKVVQ